MYHIVLADIGVPMIFVQWPLMMCVLLPVIVIEAFVVRHRLALSFRKAFAGSTKANLLSTFAGVPLAWVFMLALEFGMMAPLQFAAKKWPWLIHSPLQYAFFVFAAAWTGPPVYSAWPIALAATVLLVPTFFVSVWLERWLYRHSLPDVDRISVDRAVWTANVWSYAFLFLLACGWLGFEVHRAQAHAPPATRMAQPGIDMAYIRAVVIPSYDATSRSKLASAEEKLESCFNDLVWFVYDVEHGKIAVRKNLSTGHWESYVERPLGSITAIYSGRNGFITDFRWRGNSGTGVPYCHFTFNAAGLVSRADLPDDSFEFDDVGRLKHWHGDHADYWANPGK